jgi:hypothetical protein
VPSQAAIVPLAMLIDNGRGDVVYTKTKMAAQPQKAQNRPLGIPFLF